jgi:hypothetical protein
MKKKSANQASRRVRPVKNPVSPGGPIPPPFPQMRRLSEVPGVEAILERARSPYVRKPLTEDEALNLICDAREDEPTYPIKKLSRKLTQ